MSGGSSHDVGPEALTEAQAFLAANLPTSSGHRAKHFKPSMPFWCGLLTRVIKAGTDEFKSAPCTQAQVDERVKLEAQGTWDLLTVREWSAVRADPTLLEATVARLFVIMGRKGDEMVDADGRAAEVKYKARGVLAGNNIPVSYPHLTLLTIFLLHS